MHRYCLESSKQQPWGLLHEVTCAELDLASLLAEGSLHDLGTHPDAASAARSLSANKPAPIFCRRCCPVLPPRPRFTAGINFLRAG